MSLYTDSYSRADGATGILTSPALDSLKNQLANLQHQLSDQLSLSAEYQGKYDRRDNCGGLKKPCNDYLDKRNEANARAESIRGQITSIQNQINAELANLKAQSDAAIALATKTNSDLVKANAEAQAASDAASNQRLKYIFIGLAVLLLLAAIGYFIWWKYFKK